MYRFYFAWYWKVLVLLNLVSMGCAGPMNPFGALNFELSSPSNISSNRKRAPASIDRIRLRHHLDNKVKISFSPKRQVFHDASHFSITIDDPLGISNSYNLRVYLDGRDITSQILTLSQLSFSKDYRRLTLSMSHIRFRPEKESRISVMYSRDISDYTLYKVYEEAACEYQGFRPIRNFLKYQKYRETFSLIELLTSDENINPNFLSGLIAEESNFDVQAVGLSKGIGLTQITDLVQRRFLSKSKLRDKNREIASNDVPMIKTLIMRGKINPENEWRLDRKKSIAGGIQYLKFIKSYWDDPRQRANLKRHYDKTERKYILSDLILASYKYGPELVHSALKKHGKDWINNSDFNKAKSYIKRIKSLCYDFSTAQESVYEEQALNF